jgi:hypothetical protein
MLRRPVIDYEALRFDGFENKLNSKWIAQIVQFTTVFTNV